MSQRPRCFVCGRGLSIKHRIDVEGRLLLAIFNRPANVCISCAERLRGMISAFIALGWLTDPRKRN